MKSKEDIITEICANSNGSWVDIAWEVWDEAIKYKEAQSSDVSTPQSEGDGKYTIEDMRLCWKEAKKSIKINWGCGNDVSWEEFIQSLKNKQL